MTAMGNGGVFKDMKRKENVHNLQISDDAEKLISVLAWNTALIKK